MSRLIFFALLAALAACTPVNRSEPAPVDDGVAGLAAEAGAMACIESARRLTSCARVVDADRSGVAGQVYVMCEAHGGGHRRFRCAGGDGAIIDASDQP